MPRLILHTQNLLGGLGGVGRGWVRCGLYQAHDSQDFKRAGLVWKRGPFGFSCINVGFFIRQKIVTLTHRV